MIDSYSTNTRLEMGLTLVVACVFGLFRPSSDYTERKPHTNSFCGIKLSRLNIFCFQV